jgi:hypothetical protein
VSAILKSISKTLTIVWNPGCGAWAQAMDDEKAYPGDDVVDVIGVDCYDDGSGVSNIIDGSYGMNQWGKFARSFWDSDDGSTTSQITTGEQPNAGAKFLETFGGYAKSCR